MTDVSAIIMAATNPHRLRPSDEPFRWRQGEFVAVHPISAARGRSDNPRFYLLHIVDCPGAVEDVKAFLLSGHRAVDIPGPNGIEEGVPLARRRRQLDFSKLPDRLRESLQTKREIELPWVQLTGPGGMTIAQGGFCRERAAGERPASKDDR